MAEGTARDRDPGEGLREEIAGLRKAVEELRAHVPHSCAPCWCHAHLHWYPHAWVNYTATAPAPVTISSGSAWQGQIST